MKPAILFLFASTALAETLTPAEPPFDWIGLGGWILAAVVIVLIVIIVQHNPATVASMKASLERLTHAHATLTEKHADLVETHAEVVKQATAPPASPDLRGRDMIIQPVIQPAKQPIRRLV